MTLLRAAAARGGTPEPALLVSQMRGPLGALVQLLPGTRSPCGRANGSRGAGWSFVLGQPCPAGTRSLCALRNAALGERSPRCSGQQPPAGRLQRELWWWWWWPPMGLCNGRSFHLRAGPSETASGPLGPPRGGHVRRMSRGDGAEAKKREGRALAERGERGDRATTTAQKVKAAGRDLTYLGVILLGVGLTGALLYPVFVELFSSWSPNRVYTSALGRCRDHPEVMAALGLPISGYGETTRRGRRQHVSHLEFEQEGVKHMRVKFYISGSEPMAKGTVHAEVVQTPKGKFEYRYLFVELDTYPRRIIIIEDNR